MKFSMHTVDAADAERPNSSEAVRKPPCFFTGLRRTAIFGLRLAREYIAPLLEEQHVRIQRVPACHRASAAGHAIAQLHPLELPGKFERIVLDFFRGNGYARLVAG